MSINKVSKVMGNPVMYRNHLIIKILSNNRLMDETLFSFFYVFLERCEVSRVYGLF